ncbi:MAG: YidC/Oxa1 family membrane protein insertase, partial [Anaerolineales bacterium]|nr:YidC/Oxa1 family membrane protein insertase [Anaerolineales bacterium]
MWNEIIIFPFTNTLLLLYGWLGNSFVLSLILLTLLIRTLLIPLTAKQQKSQAKMQAMQPEIKRVQEKYKGEPDRIQKELQKIGYSPASMLGGCLPMLIQFPILIGMYRSIMHAIPAAPLQMVDLYKAAYPSWFPEFHKMIPVDRQFIWMDLSQPDRLYLPFYPDIGIPILPVLVYLTTVLQQKMMTPPSTGSNDQSAQMQRSMMTMMPLMFAFFALQFSSGLSIYFVTANIATIAQYMYLNRERMEWTNIKMPGGLQLPIPSVAAVPETSKVSRKLSTDETPAGPTQAAEEKISRRKAKRLRARKA